MKRLILSLVAIAFASLAIAQRPQNARFDRPLRPVYTHQVFDRDLAQRAELWTKSGVWKNGFTKAEPAATTNLVDFYVQYNRNPEQWQALFKWLEETDLLAIPAGKTPIPGTSLIASVEDSKNDPIENRKTESHYFNIDFMYVVKGIEGFRRLDHNTSKPSTEYKTDVIRYTYEADKLETIESVPGTFNIFFPSDWHIAKVATKHADQNIRVIVVKMPYKE